MVYKRYIKKKVNGETKVFGPYYYESYRDKEGVARTRYVNEVNDERAVTNKLSIFKAYPNLFILLIGILVIFFAISFLSYNLVKSNGEDFSFSNLAKNVYGSITGFTAEDSSTDGSTGSLNEGSVDSSIDAGTEDSSEISSSDSIDVPIDESTPAESLDESVIDDKESSGEITEGNHTIDENVNENKTVSGDLPNESSSNESETINNSGSNVTFFGPEQNESPPNEEGIFPSLNLTNSTDLNQSEVLVNSTNETILGENGTVQLISTIQYGAVLGKPVKWEKKVKVETEKGGDVDGIKIDLPDNAGNVKVKKITENGEVELNSFVENEKNIEDVEPKELDEQDNIFIESFNFFLGFFNRMTSFVIDQGNSQDVFVQVNSVVENNDEIVVEYYTDAPYSIEENISNGKSVKIIGPENMHYENVLAFTNLDESLNIKRADKIKIHWLEEDSYLPVVSYNDFNENGIIDYIEWIVPHLSNQTFEIIVITSAEHLDPNRNHVSDIYGEVKELDGVYSETISNGDYVRITFEKNLTSVNDITFFPKIINGSPRIEVYEVNGTNLISEFINLSDLEYNKVILENLVHEQDTFDLLVLDGNLQFDHIIDPTAGPNASAFDKVLRVDSCKGEDQNEGGENYSDTCDGGYPNATCGANGDLLDCDDSFNETMLAKTLDIEAPGYAGLQVNYTNSSVTNCASVDQVFVCFEWWKNNSAALSSCRITVSNGTTEKNVNTTCPGSVANPGVYCYNVTANLTWSCGNFFNSTTNMAYTESEVATFVATGSLINWDVLYYNLTYTASVVVGPSWATNSTNSTKAGSPVLHSVNWTDGTALAGYIFSFDNGTGTYTNDSFVSFTGTQNWSNVTKIVNSTVGSTIKWKVYSNNSAGGLNVTSDFSYNTTRSNNPTHSNPLISPYPNANIYQSLTCSNQSTSDPDGDRVYNVFNWKVNDTPLMFVNLPFEINTTGFSTNIVDYSGNSYNLTSTNISINWTRGYDGGGAYDFNDDGRFTISNNTLNLSTNFTINFWMKDVSNINVPFSKGNSTSGLLVLPLVSTIRTYFDGNYIEIDSPSIGAWSMYTITCKTGNCSVYLNATLKNSTTSVPSLQFKSNLTIGGDVDDGYTYGGLIDDFRIYNRTLTQSQIDQIHTEGRNNYSYYNATIVSSEISVSQNWTCEITPVDSYANGLTKINSTSIILSNSPVTTLNSPANASSVNDGATFNCSATDDIGLSNVTLYGNWTGSWVANTTVNLTGTSNSTTFNIALPTGTFVWNCLTYDNNSQSDFGDSNFTITNDQCSTTQVSSSTTLSGNQCEYYNITTNNVTFDCAGYNVTGPPNLTDSWAVTVIARDNITIKNCNFRDWRNVIDFNSTNNSLIFNTSIFNSTDKSSQNVQAVGIYLTNSVNNTINTVNITTVFANSSSLSNCYTGYSNAIWLTTNSTNNSIKNSFIRDIHGQQQGIDNGEAGCTNARVDLGYLFYVDTSANNTFYNNTAMDSYYATFVSNSIFTNLTSNNLTNFTGNAITVSTGSSSFIFEYNTIQVGALLIRLISGADNSSIKHNIISNSQKAILFSSTIGGFIDNNTIQHMNFSGSTTGTIEFISITSLQSFANNTFFNVSCYSSLNTCASVYAGSSINSNTNNFTNITQGYLFTASATNDRIVGDTFTNVYNNTVHLRNGATNVSFINVTYNKSKIYLQGSLPTFFNYYYLQVNVTSQNSSAIVSANVNITNLTSSTPQIQTTTDSNGLTSTFEVMEFNQNSTGVFNYTPHNISAGRTGFNTNNTNTTLNQSRLVLITISTPYILAYVPTSDTTSIVEPNNQTFSITFANATPVTIKWFVNGTQQNSYTNNSQFIWVGNYSQEGTYAIKVNISNEVGEDSKNWTLIVNNTPSRIDFNMTYPSSPINVSQNSIFNVTLNVTCSGSGPDCGTINVSLYSNSTIVNNTAGATPFYTNSSTNPQTTSSLNSSQSQTITFFVNATGAINLTHSFSATANLTNNMSINNVTTGVNVTIVTPPISIAIDLSTKLGQRINWTLSQLPAINISAEGNNGSGITEYWVNVSVSGGTADLYMRANDNLTTTGGDILLLGNETYSYNSTNSTVPSDFKYSMTTNFSNHKIGSALTDGAIVYLKFFLSAPSSQPAGTYNNTLYFKAVATGESP